MTAIGESRLPQLTGVKRIMKSLTTLLNSVSNSDVIFQFILNRFKYTVTVVVCLFFRPTFHFRYEFEDKVDLSVTCYMKLVKVAV